MQNGRHSKDHAQQPCRSIAWYSAGDSQQVELGGVVITVKLVGRKGRRARIAIVVTEARDLQKNTDN